MAGAIKDAIQPFGCSVALSPPFVLQCIEPRCVRQKSPATDLLDHQFFIVRKGEIAGRVSGRLESEPAQESVTEVVRDRLFGQHTGSRVRGNEVGSGIQHAVFHNC